MLRQLWAAYRNPARSLSSSLLRPPQPQRSSPWQRHFFSQSGIPRHGPRTSNHYRQGARGPRRLHARIHASIYTSIGFLVLSEELDWDSRRTLGVDVVGFVTSERDPIHKWRKFYEMGEAILGKYTVGEIEHYEDAVRIPADAGWGDQLEARVMTAPDPEVEGGTLVCCLVALKDPREDTYIPEYGNRLTDATEICMPQIEAFARGLEASPKVRGAMVLLQEDGDWKSLYWDGRRWINIVFLEWQTAESIGLPTSAHDDE